MIRLLLPKKKLLSGLLSLLLLGSMVSVSYAETKYRRVYDPQSGQYYFVPEESLKTKTQNALKNPIVKQAAVGAAVGTAASLFSDRTSVLKGAGVGALVGAGTGLVDKSTTLEDKPLARSALKGVAIGTGASIISHKSMLKGAILGAGAGTGVHYLKKYLLNDTSEEGVNRND